VEELKRANRMRKKIQEIYEIFEEVTDTGELLLHAVGFNKDFNLFVLKRYRKIVEGRS